MQEHRLSNLTRIPHHQVSRTENPLLSKLTPDRVNFSVFKYLVNQQLSEHQASSISGPRIEKVLYPGIGFRDHTVIDIPFQKYNNNSEASLSNLLLSSVVLDSDELEEEELAAGFVKKQQDGFILTTDGFIMDNPFHNDGIIVKNRNKNVDRTKEGTIIINKQRESELMLAYQASISALIAQDRLDISTQSNLTDTLPLRKSIFMSLYHEMISSLEPPIKRDQIIELDSQIDDINTNLFTPLKLGEGRPMNTLEVGASGTGKSLVGRLFARNKDVLTVPVKVTEFRSFEYSLLPEISKIQRMLNLPVVVKVDDIEGLLGRSINMDEQGDTSHIIDPQDRAEALTLLERMEDTYGIYLLCSLNHPDIEAAFLRRFNPVYFPLPNPDQRKFMLSNIIPHEVLSEGKRDVLVNNLAEKADGFNYHGLALIPDYFENLKISSPIESDEDYQKKMMVAFDKASQRMSRQGIKKMDEAARRLVGIND